MFRFMNTFFAYLAALSIPALILFFYAVSKARQKALNRFGDKDLVGFLASSVNIKMRNFKNFLWGTAIVFLLFALARPQMGTKLEEIKREGIDLVIALDLSNSMYAEDVKPNRLQKAKYEIRKLTEMLQGDRVALVIFAGDAFLQCPLTLDYEAFLLLLDSVDPSSVPLQGTAISKAIEVGQKAFVEGELKHKVMLVITDGEDHEGDPAGQAEKAAEDGVRIFTVGIGSPAGVPIPVYDKNGYNTGRVMKDNKGNIVTTRLDEETLQRIAFATDGKYYAARPGNAELDAITEAIAGMDKKEFESKKFAQFEDRFQYPLGLALIAIILAFVLPERKKVAGTLSDYIQSGK